MQVISSMPTIDRLRLLLSRCSVSCRLSLGRWSSYLRRCCACGIRRGTTYTRGRFRARHEAFGLWSRCSLALLKDGIIEAALLGYDLIWIRLRGCGRC